MGKHDCVHSAIPIDSYLDRLVNSDRVPIAEWEIFYKDFFSILLIFKNNKEQDEEANKSL